METTVAVEKKSRRARGTGRIWQMGRIWWVQYYSRGHRVRESSGSQKETVAEKLLKLRLAQVMTGTQPNVRRLTYEDLRAAYIADYVAKKHKSLRYAKDGKPRLDKVERLDKFFAGYRASAIDADVMREFIEKLQAQGKQDSTINRSLSALRRMFNLAVEDKKFRKNDVPHFPMLKEPQARRGFFEHEKYLMLSAELPEYLRPVLTIAYHTGMRRAEILTLKWNQVDFLGGMICLNAGETKNNEGRKVPIIGELDTLLRTQHAKRQPDCELVCFRVDRKGKAVRVGDFRKVWYSRCAKLKFGQMVEVGDKLIYKGLIFHDLRRTGVRNLVRAGVPESVAMKITGHKTRSVFDRYDITSEKDVKDAGSKLETYLAGQNGANSGQTTESAPTSDSDKSVPVM